MTCQDLVINGMKCHITVIINKINLQSHMITACLTTATNRHGMLVVANNEHAYFLNHQ